MAPGSRTLGLAQRKCSITNGPSWSSVEQYLYSSNFNRQWSDLKQFASRRATTMLRVAMSATNPNLFVVTVSGQAVRTADNGASWQSVSGLPNSDPGPWNWSQSLCSTRWQHVLYYAHGKAARTDGGARLCCRVISPQWYWHSLKNDPRS